MVFDFLKKQGKETESENQGIILLPDQFQFQNMRHWSELDEQSRSNLHYGFIEIVDTVPQSVRESDRAVTAEELSMLRRYSLAIGICRKAHFQYKVFDYNCAQLLDCLDFDSNGTVSFAESSLNGVYTQVNALWQNTIASGEKFLRWLDADLEERFGEDSDEVKTWRDHLAHAADVSLGCDFCYRNPAMVERDFLLLNMSGIDFDQKRTGFALNMDMGFMDHDLGDNLRTKLLSIMKDRQERGLSPQMTVNSMAEAFRAHVSLLYADYLETMTSDADKASALAERLIEEDKLNCVVFGSANAEDTQLPANLVYRVPSPYMVESYLTICAKVRQKWEMYA